MSQKVLVTGASRGFGLLMSRTLLAEGHQVIASMRDIMGKNMEVAAELREAGALVVEIDVTSESSVEQGVAQAWKRAGGLDVLINNAGIGVLGLQESFTPDDWRRIFELNVFGVQRMNRAVLPHLRAQSSGLIIHVSSLLGRMVIPYYGPYTASKFALEALAETYRVELAGLGIESVIVEPGGYGTSFVESLVRPSDTERNAQYGDLALAPEQALAAFEKGFKGPDAPNPQWVADAISQLIATPRGQRPFRTTVDRQGMGAAIEPFNKAAEELQKNLYTAFGMADRLRLTL